MSKYIIFLSIVIAFKFNAQAQVKIIDPNGGGDLDGATVTVNGNASDFELDKVIWVVNTGTSSLSLKCNRLEVDVLGGTENNTCWVLCPADYLNAGQRVSHTVNVNNTELVETIAPGDTIKTFSLHYKPNNLDGCSLFRVRWFEGSDPESNLAEVNIRFVHTTGACTVGTQEYKNTKMSISPNPAKNEVIIALSEFKKGNNLKIEIYDVLGNKVMSYALAGNAPMSVKKINTTSFVNGLYFVSLVDQNELIKTSKLLIQH